VTHRTAPALPGPRLLSALAQAAFLAVLPGGGQDQARRNAWASRSSDAARSRARREAEAAMAAAQARAGATARRTGAVGR
jgi:hypothetical protein